VKKRSSCGFSVEGIEATISYGWADGADGMLPFSVTRERPCVTYERSIWFRPDPSSALLKVETISCHAMR
jgi:hypothetical protein